MMENEKLLIAITVQLKCICLQLLFLVQYPYFLVSSNSVLVEEAIRINYS